MVVCRSPSEKDLTSPGAEPTILMADTIIKTSKAAWRNGIASDYDCPLGFGHVTMLSGDRRFDPCGGQELFLILKCIVFAKKRCARLRDVVVELV